MRASDLQLKQYESAIKIQRFMREYTPRYKAYKERRKVNIGVLELYVQPMSAVLAFRRKQRRNSIDCISRYTETIRQSAQFDRMRGISNTSICLRYLNQLRCSLSFRRTCNEERLLAMVEEHCQRMKLL